MENNQKHFKKPNKQKKDKKALVNNEVRGINFEKEREINCDKSITIADVSDHSNPREI